MRRKITFLIAAAVMLLTMVATTGEMWGQTNAKVYTLTPESSSAGTSSNYAAATDIICNSITWNVMGNTSGTPWLIGGNSITGVDRPIYSKTAITGNVSRIAIYHGNKDNELTVNSMTVTIHNNANDAASGDNPIATYNPAFATNDSIIITKVDATSWENKYYRIVYNITKKNSGNKKFQFTKAIFYKTIYSVTYNDNGATGGIAPNTTTHDAGSDITIAYNTGSLVRIGFNFSGWNTQADGEGTDYVEGATINNIAQDYTLYAKWTSASTPNIVVSGDDISNNALNLVYTESGDKTATASYNNMPSGYSNAEVALYNDLECTEAFGGDWFSASLNESDKTEIDYSANANIGVARTVYMRVSAVYDEITYYSNVITVTQAALPCTVTYNKNDEGASGTMSDGDSPYAYGSTVTVLANGFTAPTGKVFYKWNTKADASGQWYEANDTFEITENTTLYAQWSNIPTYTLVTSVSEITPGAHYVIASGKDGDVTAMGSQNESNRVAVAVIASNGVITNLENTVYTFVISGPETIKYNNNDVTVYTIHDDNMSSTGFLYAASSGSNQLKTKAELDNNGRWTITINTANDSYDAVITAKGSNSRNLMRKNSNSALFSCYGSGQSPIYLFKKDNDTDIHPYSPTTYDEDVTINDVTITSSNKITVSDGATVTLTGTVSCDDPANLVIEDGGQLITNSCIPLTYKKNITSATKDGGWYTISTPVHTSSNTFLEHESVENLILAPEQYDFFYYDEPSHYWRNYKKHEFDLNVGQGYLYRNNGAELHFAGNNNQATYYEKDLSYASTEPSLLGFNLIGNPYPQNITMSDVTVNNEGTLTGGYVLSNAGAWSADVAATIAPAQGFLVQIDKAGVTARITKPTGGSKSRANHDYLKFIVANSQYEDAAFALFDKGYGLNKIDHRNADIPMLYIPKDKQNFAIATMSDDTKSFNLNFKAMTTGKYTLSYKATGTYSYLHVIDRLTGEDVDMLLEGEYSFIASPSDAENRFIVRLEYSAGSESPESSVFAYQSGNDIIVNGEGELQIFDMMGRMISTRRVTGVETIEKPSQTGVYIFKLNEKTQKIVVR